MKLKSKFFLKFAFSKYTLPLLKLLYSLERSDILPSIYIKFFVTSLGVERFRSRIL